SSPAWPWWRSALWLALAAGAVAWQGPTFLTDLGWGQTQPVDFFQEWAAGRNLLAGLPVYANQRDNCQRYLGFRPTDEARFFPEVNAHPPASVLLALPFSLLAYAHALLLWNLLSLAG